LNKNFSKRIKILVSVWSSFFLVIFALEYLVYSSDGSILKVILHFYSVLYFTLNVGLGSGIIVGVVFRLKRINYVCKSLLIHDEYQKSNDDKMAIMEQLYEIYGDCIDACDLINLCFMGQVMMGYGLVFFYTIFTAFMVYKDYITFEYLLPETTCALGFCLYYNFFLILIITMCYGAEIEVSKL
jgi:hypothetical protein